MKTIKRRLTAAALALALTAQLGGSCIASQALGHDLHSAYTQLSAGAGLTRQIFWSDTYADLRTEHYLTYVPGAGTVPAVSWGESVVSRATLTEMAQALESQGKRVVGGTNGDFYVMATGAPIGVVISGGVVRSVPGWKDSWYYAVGFRSDGTAVLGQPRLTATATFRGETTVNISGGVNKVRMAGEGLFLFTEDFGPDTLNISPGVDVILRPVTGEAGQQVTLGLDVVDPADLVPVEPASPEPTPQPTPEPAPAPTPGSEPTPQPAAGEGPEEGADESGELTGGELPGVSMQPKVVSRIDATVTQSDDLIVNGRVTCTVEAVVETAAATAIEPGTMVLSVNRKDAPALVELLLGLQTGDRVDLDLTAAGEGWDQVREAMGAMYQLVKDGQVSDGLSAERTARTAVGVRADGSVIFYTMDGNHPGYSVGATLTQVAMRLVELGCVEAMGLDGGGSTTVGATLPGEESFALAGRPANGVQRANSVGVFLVTTPGPTGALDHFDLTPGDAMVLAGTSLQLSARGMDSACYPIDTVTFHPRYSVSEGPGQVTADGRFTAGSDSGQVRVNAVLGRFSGESRITVVARPDRLSLTNEQTGAAVSALALSPGEQVDLKAEASYRKLPLVSEDSCYTWTVEGDVGTVDSRGVFTAGDSGGQGSLTVSVGEVSLTVSVSVAGHMLEVESFEDGVEALAGGESAQVFWEQGQENVRFGKASARVEYTLGESGAAWVEAMLPLAGGERYLNLWVRGDASGNLLSMVTADGEGTLTETALTALDFTGWRYVTAPLPPESTALRWLKAAAGGGEAGGGTIWLDQVTTANAPLTDGQGPVVHLAAEGGVLTGSVLDDVDRDLTPQNLTLTYDGQPLAFVFEGTGGTLRAQLPETDGRLHRVTLTARDAAGNLSRASLDLPSGGEREPVFLDMEGHWAGEQVVYLYDRGTIAGIETAQGLDFEPDSDITRGAFFLMTARWLGLELGQDGGVELPFDDASEIPAWALEGVKAMYAAGYLKGSLAGDKVLVQAEATISRAEAMTILGRIQAKGYAAAALEFADAAAVPQWAAPYAETLVAQGVVQGDERGIRPDDPITRAEAAKLLYTMT